MARTTTNAIGTGTTNLCVNVPIDERALYGALAQPGENLAAVLKRLLAKGLEVENAVKAIELKNIRRRYYGTVSAVLALFSLTAALTGVEMCRPARAGRVASVRMARGRKEMA